MGVGQRLAVLSRTESWSRRRHQSHPRRRRASPRRVALPNASPLRRCRCPLGGRCGWSRGWARRGDTALAMEAGRRSAPRQTEEPRAEAAPWAPSAQPQLRLGQRHLPQAAPQRLELCRRQSSQRAGASKASNTAVGETWLLGRRPRRPWRWRAMVALRGRSGQLAAHFSAGSSRGASARATAQKRARGPAARRLEAEYWAASCRWCTSHWKRCDRRRDARHPRWLWRLRCAPRRRQTVAAVLGGFVTADAEEAGDVLRMCCYCRRWRANGGPKKAAEETWKQGSSSAQRMHALVPCPWRPHHHHRRSYQNHSPIDLATERRTASERGCSSAIACQNCLPCQRPFPHR